MKKRMLALLLTLCMVVSLLPAQLVIAEGTDGEQTEETWEIQGLEDTAAVGEEAEITATVNGETATEVNWSISDSEAAVLTHLGGGIALVTFLSEGAVEVRATDAYDNVLVSKTVTVGAGASTVQLTQGDAQTLSVPAGGAVLVKFTSAEEGEYVFYWPENIYGYELIFDIWDADGWSVGKGSIQTSQSNGTRVKLDAQTRYTIRLFNSTEKALSFDLNVLPETEDVELTFWNTPEISVNAGNSSSIGVSPKEPNGILGEIIWTSTNTEVVDINVQPDNTEWVELNFIAEGEATITATNSTNGAKVSHTFYVFAADVNQTVAFDGNGGVFAVATRNSSWDTDYYGELVPAGMGMGDVNVEITDPTSEYGTFAGWLPHVRSENGPVPVEGAEMLTTTQALAYPAVKDQLIIMMAQWPDWDDGSGAGDPGEETMDNVFIYANNGTYDCTWGGGVLYEEIEGFGELVPTGQSLADAGVSVSNVKYWTQRPFKGWALSIYSLTNMNGDNFWEDVTYRYDVKEIYTTAEMLSYEIFLDSLRYEFNAVWEGSDSDYIAEINFDGRGAVLTMSSENGEWTINGYTENLKKDGTKIGAQMTETVKEVTGDPSWGTFEGWLACERDENWKTYLISDTVYTMAQIQAMVPDKDITFVPKWSAVALADYEEMFGIQPPFFPDDAVINDMKVGTEYALSADEMYYFTFTAPADGFYVLNSDAPMGIDTDLVLEMYDRGAWNINVGAGATMELVKGDTLKFKTQPVGDYKLWAEKLNTITKMEVISQDKTPSYLALAHPGFTLKDLELKLTFEDGTTAEVNGSEMWRYGQGYNGLPVGIEMDISTGVVTLVCCGAELQYQVKLDEAHVVDMEVIPTADMFDFYENTFGFISKYGEDGDFFYYEAEDAVFQFATYKFTWSDGTVEEFHLDPKEEPHYHGVELYHDGSQWMNPWGVGTHTFEISFGGGLTDTVEVEIKENPVKSIKLLSMSPAQYTLGDPDYFAETNDGWCLKGILFEKYQLQVTYKDGTTEILTEADESSYRDMFWLLDGKMADSYWETKAHTAPGKQKIYMTFMGQESEFVVDIVEQAVVDGNASVSDTTVEKALEDVKDGSVTLDVTTDTAASTDEEVVAVKLPVASVETLVEKEEVKQVEIKLDSATVTLDAKALEAIADQAEGATITLAIVPVETEELTEKQQAVLEDEDVELVLTALVLSDGEPIGDFKGGSVKVQIPFTPESGYEYKVAYVADDGTMTIMTTEVGKNHLAFWTGHFSDYVVLKDEEKEGEKPTDSIEPSETTKPTETTEPSETTKPTEPSETTQPTEPAETTKPTETAKPSNPTVPDTGDHSGIAGMTVMMLTSGALLAAALWLVLRKRSAA